VKTPFLISIVDTGVSNIASVKSALNALGLDYELVSDPAVLGRAEIILLPGVGSFESGMKNLTRKGLDMVLIEKIRSGTPTLAICLGMQLLCEGSAEAPGLKGLGIIPGICDALPNQVRVPQQGWNYVSGGICQELAGDGYAAFANSYTLRDVGPDWSPSRTTYGYSFVSAVYKDGLFACQFHPELSGSYGLRLIERWTQLICNSAVAQNVRSSITGQELPDEVLEDHGPAIRMIPCMDVAGGSVVKGVHFQNLRQIGDPAELAERYQKEGADEIVFLDIQASPDNANTSLESIRRVRSRLHIPLTVGGGIRSIEDANRILENGADKISVNSAAVRNPELISTLSSAFGKQCIVVAIDARRSGSSWEVLINGGRQKTSLDARAWAVEAERRGAGEILLTSWDRDGTRSGPDAELVKTVSDAVSIPVICSGGIGSVIDAEKAIRAGADAVLAASIFHDADFSVSKFKQKLRLRGVPVRL
jgi:imidazole glycerol phosphate synthase glutamine amidotransferase subunit